MRSILTFIFVFLLCTPVMAWDFDRHAIPTDEIMSGRLMAGNLPYHLYRVLPHGLKTEIITMPNSRTVCAIVIARCKDISTS